MIASPLYSTLQLRINQFEKEYSQIPKERMNRLLQLASYVKEKQQKHEVTALNFICTHNSRRSHISQLWAQAAAAYYGVDNVYCYSGGTEATAFNPRAVKAMSEVGFRIVATDETENPRYEVFFSKTAPSLIVFSKVYNDPFNPSSGYVAIMTCSHADENCPLVVGSEARISLPFDDPKEFDDTALEATKYHERVLEIGKQICYAFSLIAP